MDITLETINDHLQDVVNEFERLYRAENYEELIKLMGRMENLYRTNDTMEIDVRVPEVDADGNVIPNSMVTEDSIMTRAYSTLKMRFDRLNADTSLRQGAVRRDANTTEGQAAGRATLWDAYDEFTRIFNEATNKYLFTEDARIQLEQHNFDAAEFRNAVNAEVAALESAVRANTATINTYGAAIGTVASNLGTSLRDPSRQLINANQNVAIIEQYKSYFKIIAEAKAKIVELDHTTASTPQAQAVLDQQKQNQRNRVTNAENSAAALLTQIQGMGLSNVTAISSQTDLIQRADLDYSNAHKTPPVTSTELDDAFNAPEAEIAGRRDDVYSKLRTSLITIAQPAGGTVTPIIEYTEIDPRTMLRRPIDFSDVRFDHTTESGRNELDRYYAMLASKIRTAENENNLLNSRITTANRRVTEYENDIADIAAHRTGYVEPADLRTNLGTAFDTEYNNAATTDPIAQSARTAVQNLENRYSTAGGREIALRGRHNRFVAWIMARLPGSRERLLNPAVATAKEQAKNQYINEGVRRDQAAYATSTASAQGRVSQMHQEFQRAHQNVDVYANLFAAGQQGKNKDDEIRVARDAAYVGVAADDRTALKDSLRRTTSVNLGNAARNPNFQKTTTDGTGDHTQSSKGDDTDEVIR